jgi:ATP-binding cassette, subfamily B, bacterial PglK
MFVNLKKIYSILDRRGKINLIFVFFILILIGILDTIGIGLIFPLLSVIFEDSSANIYVKEFFQSYFNINSKDSILKILIISFCAIIILKNVILVFSVWIKEKFLLNLSSRLSTNLLSVYLDKPMMYHMNINSSELVRNLVSEIKNIVKSFILSFINIFSETIFLLTILVLLSFNNFKVTIISFLCLVFFSILMVFIHRNSLGKFGEVRLKYSASILKILKESFDSIKEIKVGFLRDNVVRNYFKFFNRIGKMNILVFVFGSLPKPFFEIIIVIFLTFVLFYSSSKELNIIEYLPTIALYFAAIYRAMPSLTRMINNIQSMRYSNPSFKKVEDDLLNYKTNKIDLVIKKIDFNKTINFENISFAYDKNNLILNKINFQIKKNSFIGIFGQSGSGKSTLLDLLLGLLQKNEGIIKIDNKEADLFNDFNSWAQNISFVPQSIYIYDETIEKNITLIDDKKLIDYKSLEKVIKLAKLTDFIENTDNGLDTHLGELGDKISGGQKQRIGIARALYKNSKILIFDESTNALDYNTEKEILINLSKLKNEKTIIFASHSTKILEELSDEIINIKDGKI